MAKVAKVAKAAKVKKEGKVTKVAKEVLDHFNQSKAVMNIWNILLGPIGIAWQYKLTTNYAKHAGQKST